MIWLKQSTAATIKLGPFVDDTDGKTAETALTISQADVRLSKNGGDMAQKNDATAATHDELGYYDVPLNATDTGTLGRLRVMVTEPGALAVWDEFMVVPANAYDSLVLGTDYLTADTMQVEGADATDSINAACDVAISDAALPAAVWAVGTRTLTSFGTLVADIAAAVWSATTRTLSAFGFGVTVAANNDKTGYSGTATNLPTDYAKPGDAMALTLAERTSVAASVWGATTRTLTAAGAPPAGYTRYTIAAGTLLPGTVIDAYLPTDTGYADPQVDNAVIASNGGGYIDLPENGAYTLVGRLAGKADTILTGVTT